MTGAELAQALRRAVLEQDFGATPDVLEGGAPLRAFPSLDLALVAFPANAAPVFANVLFSRDYPQGVIATIPPDARPVADIRFDADLRDAGGVSVAWQPGADWSQMPFGPIVSPAVEGAPNSSPHRFVAPYPASLLKLMVAVGVGILFDAGVAEWDAPWTHAGRSRPIAAWCEDMITLSCNDSTSAMVGLLHACRLIGPRRNVLHTRFDAVGLHTLRLDGTQPGGGWGNAAGAGVGRIHMTAWDSVRLLWLLDPHAPRAPWPGAQPLLSLQARDRVLGFLRAQQHHHVLGLPAGCDFLHKTGTTENYGSDAGIVRARAPQRRHYTVALLSNLGSRYAGGVEGAVNPRLPALGAAIDGAMKRWLEEVPA